MQFRALYGSGTIPRTSALSPVLLLWILPSLRSSPSCQRSLVLAQHSAQLIPLTVMIWFPLGWLLLMIHTPLFWVHPCVEIIRHHRILHVDKTFRHLSDKLILKNSKNNDIKLSLDHSELSMKNEELRSKEWPGWPAPPGTRHVTEKEPTSLHTLYLPR